ncbi:Acetylornithine deacetylase/Succinyl-diaminopimelate desuccinylase and related deacylases [hydrothermal vent metagenome]|uniref:Acetylornithine deacetylase/Succinyl-diaminopimelate desuccinylase and related deacylases n=1 Tax=hydrothermal vent metagenome TaxID=652676 RepID=A0A3B0W0Z9_9ZZZZ
MITNDTKAIWEKIDSHIEENIDYWIEQLAQLCAQPSVSAQNEGIEACADLVATMLREQGFAAEVMPSDGYPVVYGEGNGRSDKTLLFYLHYDVQPPEPLELWDSPPFELTHRDGKLYARGISDDKGHIICRLAALAAVKDVLGELPCNVKFIIEGEEEIGSPNMPAFVEKHQEKLAADACIWEFGGVDYDGCPELALGMRGICYVELSVQTAAIDAHSGLTGSIFPNAAWRLTWALSSLKDQNEHILIPGFYDNVQPPSARDLEMLAAMPPESAKLKEMFQLDSFLNGMTDELELKKTAVFEPTCTICGLTAGYQAAGVKTVLPANASAKVDFRLVPNQTPEEIVAKLRTHLDANGFTDVEIKLHGGGRPAKVDPDDPFVQLTIETAVSVYGKEPNVMPIIGGSGPNYPFIHTLGLPLVSAGVGYPGAQVHAPNENIRLDYFLLGTKHTARIIEQFG